MNITVIGRGNVGGSLARLWRSAGHDVQELGRDGGDATNADVLVLAVPWAAIPDALANVRGATGKTTIDATNFVRGERPDFPSLAHQVKSIVGGATAKAFNLNYAALYDEVPKQDVRPGSLFAADDEAREVTEQLIRDAGLEPLYGGGLENARALEDFLGVLFAWGHGFYRFWTP
jgi:8-hydroxy-5-deazaflavin:NADPH oxidoreductase